MWIVLGFGAILTAGINVFNYIKNKEAKFFRFISLSLTALTVCMFYRMDAKWVLAEDWTALMDVTPTTARVLWILTIVSILVNSISLFDKKQNSLGRD